ncbi:hypothetical protein ACE7GA_24370 [Roseomonas sp. CCTCC AB2023176]|uniref:hypothetical protein n=1 Tax=Roseomonas sp. CCTCC AB2023176 TaxID=3342640 RepID=UPI0035DB6444
MPVEIHDAAPAPVPETASQAIVRAANQPRVCTDSRGRRIVWKALGAFDNMKLAEIVGASNIENGQYMLFANAAYSVQEIDGERTPKPATKLQLEALVQRLGDEGIEALFESAAEAGRIRQGEGGRADPDSAKGAAGTLS